MKARLLHVSVKRWYATNRIHYVFKHILHVCAQLTLDVDHAEVRVGDTEGGKTSIELRISTLRREQALTIE